MTVLQSDKFARECKPRQMIAMNDSDGDEDDGSRKPMNACVPYMHVV